VPDAPTGVSPVAATEAARGDTAAADGFRPTLGVLSATTLIVGSSIGSGIFLLPSVVAGQAGAPGLTLLVWVVGGLLSLAGALAFAELGSMFPRAGGQYVFLRESYGRSAAFLFGWMTFWVSITGIIAAVATAFAIFVGAFFPLTGLETKFVAIGCIWFLTLVNWFGVRYGGVVQNVATIAKVIAILALVGAAFLFGAPQGSVLAPLVPAGSSLGIASAFGLGLVAALFAFDGWTSVTFIGSELRNPRRTIPIAATAGVGLVTAIYLLANAAYLRVLPFPSILASQRVAFDVATAIVGSQGGSLLAAAVIVSTFGTVNGYVLQGPRVYYAMARDRVFYPGFGSLSKRAVPAFGLLLQAEWASLLVLTGSYAKLVTYVVIGLWVFYGITGYALFRLRRHRPDAERPYRVPGYPVVPALFVAAAIFIVLNALVNDTGDAIWGLVLIATGVPVLALLRWRERRGPAAESPSDSARPPPPRAPQEG
jgi:APA family basic amino acid/polyamine antiporter